MHSCRNSIAIAVLALATLLAAQEPKKLVLQSFNGDVPFEFRIGDRKFHAGHYEFVVVGSGLMAMRDSHAKILAMLITRQLHDKERDVAPRFIFERVKGRPRLASIWMEKGAQGYQIVGEDMLIRQVRPGPPPILLAPPIHEIPSLVGGYSRQ